MNRVILTRNELYDLVWSEPVLSLSKKWGIPGSRLRSICQKMKIPLPKAGYWQKLQHNKPVLVHPLPEGYAGEDRIEILLNAIEEEKNAPLTTEESRQQLQKTTTQNVLPSKVPSKLVHPDPLITAAKVTLSSGNGRYYQHGGLVWTAENQIDIRVAPKNIGRALRFMDTLIKLLRTRGHDIEISYGTTYLVIDKQKIEFQLKELMRSVYVEHKSSYADSTWTSREYQATGQFALRVGKYSTLREWKDGKLQLEDQLRSIVTKLEALAEKINIEQIERDKWHQQQQEKWRVEKELKEQKEREAQAFKDFLEKAQQWQQAKMLREYIAAVESKAQQNDHFTDDTRAWLEWAQQKADDVDPLKKALQ